MSALAEALVAAQAELPTALKRDADGEVNGRAYKYLTLDKLIEATRPILTKHGIAISQWPEHVIVPGTNQAASTLRSTLVTRLEHATSDSRFSDVIEYTMPLYVTEATMQGLGSAITYARRYAWASALGIAAEEDTDAKDEIPF